MFNEINNILSTVRALPLETRKLFAAHKSKAIHKKKMSDDDAIRYAWQKLDITTSEVVTTPLRSPSHTPKPSFLQRLIRGDS